MSDNIKNSNQLISYRLNHSNYNAWRNMVETFIRQKILIDHITYGSYDDYRCKTYVYSSVKEKKYFTAKIDILSKKIPDADKDIQLEKIEEDYKLDSNLSNQIEEKPSINGPKKNNNYLESSLGVSKKIFGKMLNALNLVSKYGIS